MRLNKISLVLLFLILSLSLVSALSFDWFNNIFSKGKVTGNVPLENTYGYSINSYSNCVKTDSLNNDYPDVNPFVRGETGFKVEYNYPYGGIFEESLVFEDGCYSERVLYESSCYINGKAREINPSYQAIVCPEGFSCKLGACQLIERKEEIIPNNPDLPEVPIVPSTPVNPTIPLIPNSSSSGIINNQDNFEVQDEICFDSDGSNFFEKGYIVNNDKTLYDSCYSNEQVWEYSCSSGKASYSIIDCRSYLGDYCENGACKSRNEKQPSMSLSYFDNSQNYVAQTFEAKFEGKRYMLKFDNFVNYKGQNYVDLQVGVNPQIVNKDELLRDINNKISIDTDNFKSASNSVERATYLAYLVVSFASRALINNLPSGNSVIYEWKDVCNNLGKESVCEVGDIDINLRVLNGSPRPSVRITSDYGVVLSKIGIEKSLIETSNPFSSEKPTSNDLVLPVDDDSERVIREIENSP